MPSAQVVDLRPRGESPLGAGIRTGTELLAGGIQSAALLQRQEQTRMLDGLLKFRKNMSPEGRKVLDEQLSANPKFGGMVDELFGGMVNSDQIFSSVEPQTLDELQAQVFARLTPAQQERATLGKLSGASNRYQALQSGQVFDRQAGTVTGETLPGGSGDELSFKARKAALDASAEEFGLGKFTPDQQEEILNRRVQFLLGAGTGAAPSVVPGEGAGTGTGGGTGITAQQRAAYNAARAAGKSQAEARKAAGIR